MSKRSGQHFLVTLLLLLPLMILPHCAGAHKIRPVIIDAVFSHDGQYKITIKNNLEAFISRIGPEHEDTKDAPQALEYNRLRALSSQDLDKRFAPFAKDWRAGVKVEFDGVRVSPKIAAIHIPETGDLALARNSTIVLSGLIPARARVFRFAMSGNRTTILRVKRAGIEGLVTALLKTDIKSPPVPLEGGVKTSFWRVFVGYVALGYEHILPKGLDHILFVLGLYLLNTSLRPLLVQVTAFTLAHSITLGLGLYGVVNISSAIVEPLIAISIVYVAVENLFTNKLSIWRPLVVFMFGLLHGLGFASVLTEIGLPRADFVTGLVAFNVGIELGQLSVIAIAFLFTGLWFRKKDWYRQRIVWPASAAIAFVGSYWTIERILF